LLVLDTNIVLDWLLFDDPRCLALADAIASSRVRWIASAPMRSEIEDVLGRGIAAGRSRDAAGVLAGWDRWASMVEPWERPSPRALQCSDGDDQIFIDLALQVRASALLSRDRAVLRLARPAALHGLAIVSIADWQPPAQADMTCAT
jgi:predicted nucleic acid-binding protein